MIDRYLKERPERLFLGEGDGRRKGLESLSDVGRHLETLLEDKSKFRLGENERIVY